MANPTQLLHLSWCRIVNIFSSVIRACTCATMNTTLHAVWYYMVLDKVTCHLWSTVLRSKNDSHYWGHYRTCNTLSEHHNAARSQRQKSLTARIALRGVYQSSLRPVVLHSKHRMVVRMAAIIECNVLPVLLHVHIKKFGPKTIIPV